MDNFSDAGGSPTTTVSARDSALIIGKRIKHYRTLAGLTLTQLSDKTGLSISQLSLFENGKREPKPSTLGKIAASLHTETAKLLEKTAPDKRSSLEIRLAKLQRSSALQGTRLANPIFCASTATALWVSDPVVCPMLSISFSASFSISGR